MMSAPIVNPPMPLLTPIPGGFHSGKVIRIQGTVLGHAQRFAINLQCGPNTNPRDDLALHFSARLHERVVARNSLSMGCWGVEEHHGHSFPFLPGAGFELLILAQHNEYKIAVNGQHFCEFHCRLPMERVSYLSADGEIMITTIHFEGGSHGGHMPGHGGHMPGHVPVAPMPYPTHTPGVYPTQTPGAYPAPGMAPGYPVHGVQPGYPVAGYPAGHMGHMSPKSAKKAAKQQRKAQKKALKYGLPIAGAGIGAYALHKGMKHHHHGYGHHGHSSSSSSSSSEEE